MTTKDYQTRSPLRIFLSYFKPHRRLFALDLSCAFLIACMNLAFPLVSRAAMYTWLPQRQFRVFFIVMAVVVAGLCAALGAVLRGGLLGPHLRHPRRGGHPPGPVPPHAGAGLRLLRPQPHRPADEPPDQRPVRADGAGPPRAGGSVHLPGDHRGRAGRDVHHPLGAGAGTAGAAACPADHGHAPPPADERRLPGCQGRRPAPSTPPSSPACPASGPPRPSPTRKPSSERFDEANEVFKTAKRGFHKEMGRFNAGDGVLHQHHCRWR